MSAKKECTESAPHHDPIANRTDEAVPKVCPFCGCNTFHSHERLAGGSHYWVCAHCNKEPTSFESGEPAAGSRLWRCERELEQARAELAKRTGEVESKTPCPLCEGSGKIDDKPFVQPPEDDGWNTATRQNLEAKAITRTRDEDNQVMVDAYDKGFEAGVKWITAGFRTKLEKMTEMLNRAERRIERTREARIANRIGNPKKGDTDAGT